MDTEKQFREKYKDLSYDQLMDLAYRYMTANEKMKENLLSLRRRFYGHKSEKINPDQMTLFNEAEMIDEDSSAEEKKEPTAEETLPKGNGKKKRKGTRNSKLRNVRVVEEHNYPDNTKTSPEGGKLSEIKPRIVEYLEYIPSEYVLHRVVIHNYTCKEDNVKADTMKVYNGSDKLPKKILPGSFITPSLLSHIVISKYQLGVPLYRQSEYLEKSGIHISRQSMAQWIIKVSQNYLELLYRQMIEDIRKCAVLNCDETTLQCLEELAGGRSSDSYAWLVMSGEHEDNQMAVYFYDATREYGVLEKIIGPDFHNVLQSDGYGAYAQYEGTDKKAGCWAHARRKFFDVLTSTDQAVYKKFKKAKKEEQQKLIEEYPSFGMIMQELAYIDQLFDHERKYKEKGYTPDEILAHRQEDDPEILDKIHKHTLNMQAKTAPGGKLWTAITYCLNQWEPLNYFMKDGRVSLTNNIAEREGIKPLVMARKNFLFADTREGAKASMIWFSLIISAAMNHLNPEKYLRYILHEAAEHPMTDELIAKLLPYSKNLPSDLKVS